MEKTAEQTAAGKEELTKAERSHRRSPAMSVHFFLIIFPLFFLALCFAVLICQLEGHLQHMRPCVLTLNHYRSLATSLAAGFALVCIGSVEGTRDMRKSIRSLTRLTQGVCAVQSS
jgi:hypothetical protein